MLRCHGRSGLQEHIRRGVALAEHFEHWVQAEPEWELVPTEPAPSEPEPTPEPVPAGHGG